MDCIASAAFGLQVDSQNNPDDQFVKYAKSILNFNIYNPLLLIILVFPSTSKFLERVFGYQIISKETVAFFVDVIEKAMEFRHGDGEDQETKRVDFLQLMLNAHKDNDSEITDDEKLDENHDFDFYKEHGLSKDEILGHSFLFFLAGYDTVSSCLSFTSYLLATNVEVQDRLVDEINDTLQDCHQLSFEVISKMNYLDMVLCESLRLYPPAVVTDRRCCRDTEIGGVFLKKDMRIIVPIWVIHHDPELWPEPDRFLPERFTKEEKEKRHPLAWMPFGIGPRNCIGMRFALMEAKIALIKVLQKFRLEPCSKTEIPPKLKKGGLLDAQNGFWLRMTKRM
uniref:Cytochrome P450 3A41-like n=1 Tax=Saccoglossus kowalevskii TaxID=10224 RepID=A0ABM0GPB9_SACKO|nr:PREDICTED: cytochrome P450 3A41-like [Saccoglossus kowalevskii]